MTCNLRSTILPDRSGRMADFDLLSEKVLQLNTRQIFKKSWDVELFALKFAIFWDHFNNLPTEKIEENRRQSWKIFSHAILPHFTLILDEIYFDSSYVSMIHQHRKSLIPNRNFSTWNRGLYTARILLIVIVTQTFLLLHAFAI